MTWLAERLHRDYAVVVEVAEQIPAYVYTYLFSKTGEPMELSFRDMQGLKDVKLSLH